MLFSSVKIWFLWFYSWFFSLSFKPIVSMIFLMSLFFLLIWSLINLFSSINISLHSMNFYKSALSDLTSPFKTSFSYSSTSIKALTLLGSNTNPLSAFSFNKAGSINLESLFCSWIYWYFLANLSLYCYVSSSCLGSAISLSFFIF